MCNIKFSWSFIFTNHILNHCVTTLGQLIFVIATIPQYIFIFEFDAHVFFYFCARFLFLNLMRTYYYFVRTCNLVYYIYCNTPLFWVFMNIWIYMKIHTCSKVSSFVKFLIRCVGGFNWLPGSFRKVYKYSCGV